MLKTVAFVLGFVLACVALFTGTAVGPVVLAGTSLMGLAVIMPRRNPSNPNVPARCTCIPFEIGDGEYHDQGCPQVAGDPYTARVSFDAAFGPDALAPYAQTIQGLRSQHAMGILTSEQLADCIENIEQVAGAQPPRPAARKREPRRPSAVPSDYKWDPTVNRWRHPRAITRDPFSKMRTLMDARQGVYEDLVRLEKAGQEAMKALPRGIDAPGQTVMLHPKAATCELCASVYTDRSTEPAARYCDGSCNR